MKDCPTIYLICGFLGAGKTTYSKKLAKDTQAVHLNPDDVCTQRYKPEEYESNWEYCFKKTLDFLWQEIANYIKQNKDVIFDVGFWTKLSRKEAANRITQMGGKPVLYYIYAPDDILKQRIATRKGKIAKQNLLNFDNTKKLFEEPSEDENCIIIKNY